METFWIERLFPEKSLSILWLATGCGYGQLYHVTVACTVCVWDVCVCLKSGPKLYKS